MNWFFTLFKTNFYQPIHQLTIFTFLTRQQSSKSHSIRASVKQLTNQTKLSLICLITIILITVLAEVHPTRSEPAILVCSSVPKSKMDTCEHELKDIQCTWIQCFVRTGPLDHSHHNENFTFNKKVQPDQPVPEIIIQFIIHSTYFSVSDWQKSQV